MANNNKKYYWLKLKEDFFEEDAIAWIEEQENGKDYCLFYLKLCLKSLKTNGLLIRNVGSMLVPYDAKTLAKVTNTDIDTVRVAMDIFTKIGLVQILENGEIFISQLQNMVGSETSKAQLMRNKREKEKKQKLLNEYSNNVTDTLPNSYNSVENCYTEKETEKETDIDIDIDIEQQHRDRGKKEKLSVVVSKINEYFDLNKEDIKEVANAHLATGKELNYLIEKLELTKNTTNIKNLVGYLIKAIRDDYKASISINETKIPKTKFHNFTENFLDGFESEEDFDRHIEDKLR